MNRIIYFALSLSVLLALFAGVEAVPAPRNAAVSKRTSAADVKAYLAAHNNFRAKHGAAAFKWNNTLAAAAQKEVNRCIFKHSGGIFGPYGGTFSMVLHISRYVCSLYGLCREPCGRHWQLQDRRCHPLVDERGS